MNEKQFSSLQSFLASHPEKVLVRKEQAIKKTMITVNRGGKRNPSGFIWVNSSASPVYGEKWGYSIEEQEKYFSCQEKATDLLLSLNLQKNFPKYSALAKCLDAISKKGIEEWVRPVDYRLMTTVFSNAKIALEGLKQGVDFKQIVFEQQKAQAQEENPTPIKKAKKQAVAKISKGWQAKLQEIARLEKELGLEDC